MSYANNNSRNISNLLRHDALEPIQPRRNPIISQPEPIFPQQNYARQEIPIEDVFTPEQGIEKRTYRRRTPMSSGNGGQGPLNTRPDDLQIESLQIRLDQIVKFYDERHRNLETNVSERLNGLQNLVMREMPKVDNASLLKTDMISYKQAIKDIMKHQEAQNNEIATIKAIMEQRRAASQVVAPDPKEKEKMTVLFLEVVRLADSVEKMESGMGSVGRNYEARLQELEHKLANSEKNVALMSQRSVSGNELISQFGDKVMDRLQTAENNLLILGKERVRDKETINQLISQNERIGEDMQSLLRNLQGDFQNKLENRISQTVNRLIAEHEQRINAQEEIKRNLDMRERMNMQKQNHDKEEFRARYENMDSLVRAEFQRKEDSIRQLQNFIENQVKNIQRDMMNEVGNRREQESVLKTEMKRVQDSFRKEYDIYKTHQSDVLQRIGELVKEEVQVRVTSEINLKKLTSDIANQIVSDLNGVKEAIATSNKKLNLAIKEVASDSSERSGQLSHYIDQEVRKVVDVVTEKYNKMKGVFTKIAQQLREHLTNTETNRHNVEKRLTALEDNFEKLKNEVSGEIDEFYTDLDSRLKDEKEYVETVVFKKNNDLTIRVNKLEEYTNQYFELLKGNIEENKEILNNKLSGGGGGEGRSPQSEEEMKELRTIVYNIRSLTEEIKTENRESLEELRRDFKMKEVEKRQGSRDRENQLLEKVQKNAQNIKDIQDNVNELTVKVNSLRAEGGSDQNISNDKLKRINDEIDDLSRKIKDVEKGATDKAEHNEKELIKLRTDVTVLKGEVGALDDDIKKLSNQ